MATIDPPVDSSSVNNGSSIEGRSDKFSYKDEKTKIMLSNKKGTKEYRYKFFVFVIITFFNVFINYDIGVVPIMLTWIQEPYNFKSTELGIMGSLTYLGTFLFFAFWSYILSKYNTKKSLFSGILITAIGVFIFGSSVNKYMFYVSKFTKGASQGAYALFYPVWVDQFAPKKHRNLWISTIQSGLIIGTTVGYLSTTLFSFAGKYGWRYSIYTQVTCLVILLVLFSLIPSKHINFNISKEIIIDFDLCTCDKQDNTLSMTGVETKCVNESENKPLDEGVTDDNNTTKRFHSADFFVNKVPSLSLNNIPISRIYSNLEHSKNPEYTKCSKCFEHNLNSYRELLKTEKMSSWRKFVLLMNQTLFIIVCLSTSAYYFEFTGIQYWMTKIGVCHLNMREQLLHLIITIEIILSSSIGIIGGSFLIDRLICRYPKFPLVVDFALAILMFLASIAGLVFLLNQTIIILSVCIMMIILFGAASVPTLSLSSVACLPNHLKPTGSSFFMGQYNILGFMMGTLLPGVGIDLFKSYNAGLYIIYLSGFAGLFFYCIILIIKCSRLKRDKDSKINSLGEVSIVT